MLLSRLLLPQYLLFVLPFLLGLIYVLLMALGTIAPGEDVETGDVGDADTADVEVDAESDLDDGADHIGDEVDHHDHDNERDAESGIIRALSIIGVGKVPLSIVITSFCFVWGLAGVAGNMLMENATSIPLLQLAGSTPLALICSIIFTRYLALGLARVMPKTETYGVSIRDLVGRQGEALYNITSTFGQVAVYDQFCTRHVVDCRLKPDQELIPVGTEVVLMEYHPEGGYFNVITVEQFELRLATRTSKR